MQHIKPGEKICIVGIGNTLRSDDGIGAYVCKHIEAMELPNITILIVQQLQTDLIEEFLTYNYVVLVDAALTGKEVEFYELATDTTEIMTSSHYASAHVLNSLSQLLYNQKLPLLICGIRGETFDMSETLSPHAITNGNKAIKLLCNWLISSMTILPSGLS